MEKSTTERWGSGFVYSLDLTTDDEAEERIVKFYAEQGIKYEPLGVLSLMQVDVTK